MKGVGKRRQSKQLSDDADMIFEHDDPTLIPTLLGRSALAADLWKDTISRYRPNSFRGGAR